MKTKTASKSVESAFDTQFALQMSDLIKFAREFPEQLATRKFPPAQTEAMAEALGLYKESHDALLTRRGFRSQQTAKVALVIEDLMAYRVELSGALQILGREEGVTAPPVRTFDSLGQSPMRWLSWTVEARSGVATLEQLLEESMDRPLVRFDALRSRLTTAVAVQQTSAMELKSLGQALRDSRARLLRLAMRLRFAGRVAFRGQPDVLRRLRVQPGLRRKKAASSKAA